MEDFRSSITKKLPLQAEVDKFNRSNSKKRSNELTIEYMEIAVRISEYCFISFVKLNMNTYKLNLLHNFSLPGYSFDCFPKLSNIELDTIQDEQMPKDFNSAIRGGICGVMGNRNVNNDNSRILYIDANNLNG